MFLHVICASVLSMVDDLKVFETCIHHSIHLPPSASVYYALGGEMAHMFAVCAKPWFE